MEELLTKIHSHAYWRVVIRPAGFNPRWIPTLGECKKLVQSAQVVLRGWDYPWTDSIEVGDDWIEGSCNWDGGRYEYWRFYRSGQFVHHFTCNEEFHALSWTPSPMKYLLVFNSLYTMSEIFEFGARLASAGVLQGDVQFLIGLHGMAGRTLTEQHPLTWPRLRGQIAKIDVIQQQVATSADALMADSAGLALSGAIDVFERFGWLSPPREHLAEQQRKFLERRLGV